MTCCAFDAWHGTIGSEPSKWALPWQPASPVEPPSTSRFPIPSQRTGTRREPGRLVSKVLRLGVLCPDDGRRGQHLSGAGHCGLADSTLPRNPSHGSIRAGKQACGLRASSTTIQRTHTFWSLSGLALVSVGRSMWVATREALWWAFSSVVLWFFPSFSASSHRCKVRREVDATSRIDD